MSEIMLAATRLIHLAFACIPQNWFVIVLPGAAFVGLVTVVRRL